MTVINKRVVRYSDQSLVQPGVGCEDVTQRPSSCVRKDVMVDTIWVPARHFVILDLAEGVFEDHRVPHPVPVWWH